MPLTSKLFFHFLVFIFVFIFSSQVFALLDVAGKGNVEDRRELKLLYTFDEASNANLILNQVHKNDLSHPTHLVIRGNRSSAVLSEGSLNFQKNAILNRTESRIVNADIGAELNDDTLVTIDLKKEIARNYLRQAVYLESQGVVEFNNLCSNDKEATLQFFFKPRNENYSSATSNLFRLQNPTSEMSSFHLNQEFNQQRLKIKVNSSTSKFRRNDLDFTGVQNEAIVSVSENKKIDKYFLLHSPAGKEGWFSQDESSSGGNSIKKINNFSGSKLLIGTANFKYGVGVSDKINQLNLINNDEDLREFIQYNAGGYVGSIEQIAFYCRKTTQSEALGGEYLDTSRIKVTPSLTGEPTQAEKVAVRLLSLIAKKKIPIDAGIVKDAAVHIGRGDYKKAARIGVELPDFYNNTVKEMGLKMSNREESVDVPLNDFAATMVGVVRDQINAKELLTGNFYYRGHRLVGVPADLKTHILQSNIHYNELDKQGYDLKKALVRVDGQKILDRKMLPISHPDPAGVLTSRAYLSAHAVAGTNRRQVEYAFKEFMCLEMSEVADTEVSDLRVGRDIDRFPANSNKKYQTSCKGCHTVMDGFRGAFAKIDFHPSRNFVMHGDQHKINRVKIGKDHFDYPKDKNIESISYKVNHNEFVFPNGYVTRDDSFYNYANRGSNKVLLGWRSPASKGYGIGQFGQMISESKRFSQCMVKRVFEAICPVNINENILSKLENYVNDFEKSGYNMKALFIEAAVSPLCLGGN